MFFKVRNKKYYTIEKGFKRFLPLFSTLKFVNWQIGGFMVSFLYVINRLGEIKSEKLNKTEQTEKFNLKKVENDD